jgi:manganese transport protein
MKQEESLSEVFRTVNIPEGKNKWKKFFAFVGPAYLVSVGYMDPGNWATDIAGGSMFGYQLLWVLLMSNLIALLLQSLSARLGIVRGLDLAQASKKIYAPWVNIPLYVIAEIAIAACDLAEIIGMAIGLQLLFDLPLIVGISITVFDTLLLLFLMNKGIKILERFIISLIFIIGVSFLTELFIAQPEIVEVGKGLIPSALDGSALYIAIGIIGATVMPHNLYLHSSLVQTRSINKTKSGIKDALKYNFIDSTIALNLAFFVNASILILAATAFYKNGFYEVAEIQDAHRLLSDIFGSLAPTLFAIALICAGQSSTITGTLAGQIVMEGYLNLRIRPWLRRLITRLIAVVPAFITILYFGEEKLGALLVFSQVVLSLQLGFAIIPLIHITSSKEHMADFKIKTWLKVLAWLSALVIVGLNIKLVYENIYQWMNADEVGWYMYVIVMPIVLFFAVLLLYIIFKPLIDQRISASKLPHAGSMDLNINLPKQAELIAVPVDFTKFDNVAINQALQVGAKSAKYLIIHIVESVAASYSGANTDDHETREDFKEVQEYIDQLSKLGYNAEAFIGYGNPANAIAKIVNEQQADLLVIAAHGHKGIKDIFLGSTLDALRHKVKIPVLIAREVTSY